MKSLIVRTAISLLTTSCALAVSFEDYTERETGRPVPLYGASGRVGGLDPETTGTLSLNGVRRDDVQNGPFAFAPALPDGSAWELSFSQVDSHVCAIEPRRGVIDGRDIAGIEVLCASTDAALAALQLVDGGSLTVPFDPQKLEYFIDERPQSSTFTIQARARHRNATVTVAGRSVSADGRSDPFEFAVEPVEVKVTAADRVTKKTYLVRFAAR